MLFAEIIIIFVPKNEIHEKKDEDEDAKAIAFSGREAVNA